MSRAFTVAFVTTLALIIVATTSNAFAKKAHPTTTTSPTTQETKKGKESDVETHKARATEFSQGKELDKTATQSKLDKLTSQVDALDKKVKDAETPAATTSSRRRRARAAATQPATHPTTQESTKRSRGK